jgi:hypothetical protein
MQKNGKIIVSTSSAFKLQEHLFLSGYFIRAHPSIIRSEQRQSETVIAYVIGLSYNNANREKRKMPSFFFEARVLEPWLNVNDQRSTAHNSVA